MATNYYVDGAVGNDSNAGTSEGSGNALLTIAAGVAKLTAAGDHLYIKASVTYPSGNSAVYPLAGLAASPIITEGYTSTPGDGGMVTIDCAGISSVGSYNYRNYCWVRNITIKNSTSHAWNWASADYCSWTNCKAIDNTNAGFYADNYCSLDRCVATGNKWGIYLDANPSIVNCYVYDNSDWGVKASTTSLFMYNCLVAGGSNAVVQAGNSFTILNCTIDGFGTDTGLLTGNGIYPSVLMNNIFHDCGTAISVPTSPNVCVQIGYNNMMNSNTTNYANWTPTDTDFSGTPDFTDEANGDYSLDSASDAIGAGYGGLGETALAVDCGAYRVYEAPGGGGGQIVLTS